MSTIRLRDGRILGYREHGLTAGSPVFWFPGTPSSRDFVPPDADAATRRNLRIVVVERPGYGTSDPQPGRTFLDWPRDVEQLAEALGLARFVVAGFSGGGPYATACAFAMPSRVRKLVVIGAAAPFDLPGVRASLPAHVRPLFALAQRAPRLFAAALRLRGPSGASLQRAMLRHLAPCDQRVLTQGDVLARQIALTEEALRQGYGAWVRELHLMTQPWGFRLDDVRVPTELLWGADDRTTSTVMAHTYERIPGARLRIFADAGHFVHFAHWTEVLDAFTAS